MLADYKQLDVHQLFPPSLDSMPQNVRSWRWCIQPLAYTYSLASFPSSYRCQHACFITYDDLREHWHVAEESRGYDLTG